MRKFALVSHLVPLGSTWVQPWFHSVPAGSTTPGRPTTRVCAAAADKKTDNCVSKKVLWGGHQLPGALYSGPDNPLTSRCWPKSAACFPVLAVGVFGLQHRHRRRSRCRLCLGCNAGAGVACLPVLQWAVLLQIHGLFITDAPHQPRRRPGITKMQEIEPPGALREGGGTRDRKSFQMTHLAIRK